VANNVQINRNWQQEVLNDPAVKNQILAVADAVKNAAAMTASSAEKGPGGTIDGYAAAGFRVEWDNKRKPQAKVYSNANIALFMKAYWYTQKRDGVAHLRAALYSQIR
jgi:hypothetical protein